MPKRKLLFTVHDFKPKVGGSGEVVYQLAKRFARAGNDVTVATQRLPQRGFDSIDNIRLAEFNLAGNRAKGYRGSPSEIRRYQKFLTRGNFEVIINYAAQSWTSDLALEVVDQISAKKILVPCGYTLHDPRYFFYFRWLPKVLKKHDHLVYLSKTYQDYKFHQKHGLKNEVIIPNGAEEEEFLTPPQTDVRQRYGITTPYLAICVSNYFWLKGQDFVLRAFNQLKRDDLSMVMIGAHTNPWYWKLLMFLARNNPRIRFLTDLSRSETIDWFKAADVFLFGSRLECSPLVMFESFASRTLFITRDVGNTAEYRDYNTIVDSPQAMSQALDQALNQPDWRKNKVSAAFQKYLADHTYKKLFQKYQALT